jgi:hypothetical protein
MTRARSSPDAHFASATDQFKQMTSGTISAGNDAVNKVTT